MSRFGLITGHIWFKVVVQRVRLEKKCCPARHRQDLYYRCSFTVQEMVEILVGFYFAF